MKQAVTLLALVVATLWPALVEAKALEDVSFGADANDVIITVLADEALRAPAVRTYSGLVRVRFYDADELPTLRFDGDGSAIRVIELSRGSDKSAALNIALGDKTKLALSDVRIEREAEKTVIRIARGLLPPLGKAAAGKASTRKADKPVVAEPAAAAPAAPAEPPAALAPAPPTPPAAAEKTVPAQKPIFASAPKDDEKKPGLKLAPEQSSTMPMLIALTALLAVAYGAIKLFMKKHNVADAIPAINVVAQKRLGPRHQLVIVRAFDRDYLLSIQGGQTTVVARSSRRNVDAAEELLSPLGRRTQSTASGAAPARDFEEDEPTFGGELFKQALEQRERAREQTSGFRLETARAQARAELARRDDTRDEREARPSEREQDLAELPTDSISDSVSGLLRLRRKAGR